MSRSGYSDDCDGWELIMWRGAVASAIRGKRGQAMLRELLAALDAMPDKRLASGSLQTEDGDYCALGALGHARGIDLSKIDPDDRYSVASSFGIAEALAAEIMYLNDDGLDAFHYVHREMCGPLRPHERRKTSWDRVYADNLEKKRWGYIRNWAASQIKDSA